MARLSRLVVAVASVVAAALAAPAVAHGDSDGYVVKAGDSLVGIAARYHVTLASLLAVNHFTVTSLIVPGQRVAIPATAASGSSAVSGGSGHTVRAGDTLVGIAAALSRHPRLAAGGQSLHRDQSDRARTAGGDSGDGGEWFLGGVGWVGSHGASG